MEGLPDDFFDSLNSELPLEDDAQIAAGSLYSSNDNWEDYVAPSWFEMIKDHNGKKPPVPSSSLIFPNGKSNNMSSFVSTLPRGREKTPKVRRQPRFSAPGAANENSWKQGWTLSKGWDKRPLGAQINPVVISEDIARVRDRFDQARAGVGTCQSGFGPSSSGSSRLEPICWPEHDVSVHISLQRYVSPGPRYMLPSAGSTLNPPSTAPGTASVSRRQQPPSHPVSQTTTSQARNITFSSKSIRMPNDTYRSPGPSHYHLDVKKPHTQGPTKLSTSGKDFVNSIYQASYSTASPGGKYACEEATRHQSTTMPVLTTKLPPKETETQRAEKAAWKRNKNPVVAILRRQQADRN